MYPIKLKSKLKKCQEAIQRWNQKQSWDYYIIASDTYKWGYEQAKKDVVDFLNQNSNNALAERVANEVGEDVVDGMGGQIGDSNQYSHKYEWLYTVQTTGICC